MTPSFPLSPPTDGPTAHPAAAAEWDARDWAALRGTLLALLPPPAEPPVALDLPSAASPEGVVDAGAALIASVAEGEISAREAQRMMRLLTAQMRLLTRARRARRDARG